MRQQDNYNTCYHIILQEDEVGLDSLPVLFELSLILFYLTFTPNLPWYSLSLQPLLLLFFRFLVFWIPKCTSTIELYMFRSRVPWRSSCFSHWLFPNSPFLTSQKAFPRAFPFSSLIWFISSCWFPVFRWTVPYLIFWDTLSRKFPNCLQ